MLCVFIQSSYSRCSFLLNLNAFKVYAVGGIGNIGASDAGTILFLTGNIIYFNFWKTTKMHWFVKG